MARKKPITNRRLAFESLENRQMLTSFGVPWPEAADLTLSFAPDGTQVGSQTSELFQTLNQKASTAKWQEQVLHAFQTWAVETNVNIGLVPDGGQSLGTLGLKQGDPRFGDIRIGAFPMASDVLAVADPYNPFVANTWVGDVFLNSENPFSIEQQGANFDLFSVLLHEAGHVLGISHSPDPASPMYEQFHQAQPPYLTPADIAGLQALYGARSPDAFDAAADNGTFAGATSLDLANEFGQPINVEAEADITSLDDTDVYRIVVPAGVQLLTVKLASAGISLLVPNLSVVDSTGAELSSTTATDPFNNDVSLSLSNLVPGGVYYLQVQSGRSDVFGIGAYHLQIQPEGATVSSDEVPGSSSYPGNIPAASASDNPSVLELTTTPGYVEHTYYETDATLSSTEPVKTYRVRSADLSAGIANVMTVLLQSDDTDAKLRPAVFDDQGEPVPSTIIYHVGSTFEVQVPSVESNRNYYVKVSDTSGLTGPIDYEITVDFDADAAHLEPFVNDSLNGTQTEVTRTLNVGQSEQFHFVLSASDWNNAAESGLQMTIIDATGKAVFKMGIADGAIRMQDVFLNEGQYAVRFTSDNRPSDATVSFQLSGATMSEPLGPQLRDTILDPVDPPIAADLQALSFYWTPGNTSHSQLVLSAPSTPNVADAGDVTVGERLPGQIMALTTANSRARDIPFQALTAQMNASAGRTIPIACTVQSSTIADLTSSDGGSKLARSGGKRNSEAIGVLQALSDHGRHPKGSPLHFLPIRGRTVAVDPLLAQEKTSVGQSPATAHRHANSEATEEPADCDESPIADINRIESNEFDKSENLVLTFCIAALACLIVDLNRRRLRAAIYHTARLLLSFRNHES